MVGFELRVYLVVTMGGLMGLLRLVVVWILAMGVLCGAGLIFGFGGFSPCFCGFGGCFAGGAFCGVGII